MMLKILFLAAVLAAMNVSTAFAAVSTLNGNTCEVNMGGIFPMRRNDAGLHREASWHASLLEMNDKFIDDLVPIQMKHVTRTSSSASANSDSGIGLLSAFDLLDEVIGIVGPASSGVAKSVQQVAKLFSMPQISYSATSPSLSDKINYPTFFRTCPSDAWQGEAMAGLAKQFNYERMAALSSNDEYGVKGVGAVQTGIDKMTPGYNLTLSYVNSFPKGVNDADAVDDMLRSIKATFTSVIVLFCNGGDARFVLERANALDMRKDHLWMVSDSAVTSPYPYDEIDDFTGMIGVLPARGGGAQFDAFLPKWQSTYNQPNFIKSTGFAPDNDPSNWVMGTATAPEAYSAYGSESINSYAPYAYDAGQAFGLAIRAIYDNDQTTPCSVSTDAYRKLLLEALKDVSFAGLTGTVNFDASLDRVGGYNIVNSQGGAWVDIGLWTQADGLVLGGTEPKWSNGKSGLDNAPPNPTTVITCYSGEFLAPSSTGGVCVACPSDTYSVGQNAPTCRDCPSGAVCTDGKVVNADNDYWQNKAMLSIVEADALKHDDSMIVHPDFYRCNDDSCCIDGGCVVDPSGLTSRTICYGCAYDSADKCDDGRKDLLCASCVDGYSEWGNTCVDCADEKPGWVVFVILMCLFLVFLLCLQSKEDMEHEDGDRIFVGNDEEEQAAPQKVGLIRRLSRRFNKKFKTYYSIVGVLIRMFLEYVQLLGLLIKVSYLKAVLPWFYMSLNFVISGVSNDEPTCLFEITPVQRSLLGAMMIILVYAELAACCAISWAIQTYITKPESGVDTKRFRAGFWRITFFCFPIFLTYELNLLACVDVDGSSVVVLFPGVTCWEGDHLVAIILFGLFCIAAVGVFPGWLIYVLNPKRNPEVQHPRIYGMLSAPFKEKVAHWFGVFFFIRRAAAFAARSAFVENLKLQKSIITLFVVIFFFVQIVYRPYRRALLNYIQFTFFSCIIVAALFQLADTEQSRFDTDGSKPYTTFKDVMVTFFIFVPFFVVPWLASMEKKSVEAKANSEQSEKGVVSKSLGGITEGEEDGDDAAQSATARSVPVYYFSFTDEDPATTVS